MANIPKAFLRPYAASDENALCDLFSDPEVMRYVGDKRPLCAAEGVTLLKKIFRLYETDPTFHVWVIQQDESYAGHAELKRRAGRRDYELIYFLQRSRWGQSLGGQVVDLLLAEARNFGIRSVIATVDAHNMASIAILHRRDFHSDPELSAELGCPAYRGVTNLH